YDFAGLAPAPAVDQQATNSSYGSALSAGTTAPTTQDVELVLGVFDVQSLAVTFTPGAGFTALPPATGGAVGQVLQPEYAIVNAPGAKTATGTLSAIASYDGFAVTYKASAARPPIAPPNTANTTTT